MANLVFINYRRSDSARAARGLYAQLQHRFGRSSVFMDVSSISPGSDWPERLKSALEKATVLIVLIGDRWLSVSDQYYRRRIDDSRDWVAKEIYEALKLGKEMLPVLLGEETQLSMPSQTALPNRIKHLAKKNALRLRDSSWERDTEEIIQNLIANHGFVENQTRVEMPIPSLRANPLADDALNALLEDLPLWEPIESEVPGEYPKTRLELRRAFQFDSFKAAMQFMASAAKIIEKAEHHPRWENTWKTVAVYFTTWDIGNRISEIDVTLAREFEQLYKTFRDH